VSRRTRPAPPGRGSLKWLRIHRCRVCQEVHLNRTAPDENLLMFLRLAVLPWAQPPLPAALRRQV
jgi:hypothetical protein